MKCLNRNVHLRAPRASKRAHDVARAGFSIVEMAVSVTIMAVVSAALAQSVQGVRTLAVSSNTRARLQIQGNRVLHEIVGDLKSSGYIEDAGLSYPYVFTPGAASVDFAGHDHAAPDLHGAAGDVDFGPSKEIVFKTFTWAVDPATGERKPNVSVDGELIWDVSEISFRLTTRADGVNYLERLVNGANPDLVAHHVERIEFDDDESSGFTIPLKSVRVRIYMRDVDNMGRAQRYFAETVVALTNE